MQCIVFNNHPMCDKSIKKAEDTIDGIHVNVAEPYGPAKPKNLAPDQQRKVVVLGYAGFYNRDAPKSACPGFENRGMDVGWPSTGVGGYRDRIDKTIRYMNSEIKKAADLAGVMYADVDAQSEGHRFCNKGRTMVPTQTMDVQGHDWRCHLPSNSQGARRICQGCDESDSSKVVSVVLWRSVLL